MSARLEADADANDMDNSVFNMNSVSEALEEPLLTVEIQHPTFFNDLEEAAEYVGYNSAVELEAILEKAGFYDFVCSLLFRIDRRIAAKATSYGVSKFETDFASVMAALRDDEISGEARYEQLVPETAGAHWILADWYAWSVYHLRKSVLFPKDSWLCNMNHTGTAGKCAILFAILQLELSPLFPSRFLEHAEMAKAKAVPKKKLILERTNFGKKLRRGCNDKCGGQIDYDLYIKRRRAIYDG